MATVKDQPYAQLRVSDARSAALTLYVSNILLTSMPYTATVGEILMLVKHFQKYYMDMSRELYGKF